MEPFSVAAALVNVVSNIASFFGARRQANAVEREGRLMAQDAIRRGEFDYARYREQASRYLGSQRASIAGQGVDVMQGSAATIRAQSESAIADDLEMIRENALREAYALRRGYRNQAAGIRAQSWGAAGNAFQSGVNAWSIYQRGRMTPNAPTIPRGAPVNYDNTYGPSQF